MSSITAQQTKLDLELVPKEKRLEIRKCNGRLNPRKKLREPTFQIILDALALTPCYYHDTSYRLRMDKKKKFNLNLEIFRDIFQICPRVHGQDFDELPTDDVIVSFFKELGYTRDTKLITDVVVDQMHQPWRTFASIFNRSLSGKTTGLDKLYLSRAQILWGMYYKNNVDYVELLWEDFTYQIDNRGPKKQDKINQGVICEDMLKVAYFGAKTMIFEDCIILTNTPYPQKELRRISAWTSQENAYYHFPIRRIQLLLYVVSSKITMQRFGE
ncbi:hypothetical protein Tco_0324960 [Tanacetum coccineum]